MNVPHLFEVATWEPDEQIREPGGGSYTTETPGPDHYIPEVVRCCEWVLKGEGEAFRLYPGPFVRVTNKQAYFLDNPTVPTTRLFTLAEACNNKTEADFTDGLYQLTEEEVECPECGHGLDGGDKERFAGVNLEQCGQCHDDGFIARPRLARVGEEPWLYDQAYFRDAHTPEGQLRLMRHAFRDKPTWHGILLRREVECPRCTRGYGRDGKIFTGSVGLECTCPACHGSGVLEEFCKVERRLLI